MPIGIARRIADQWQPVAGGTTPPMGGWPDWTNTGHSGSLTTVSGTITATAGQTIQNLYLPDGVRVFVPGVTVRNCHIQGWPWPIDAEGASGLLVEDCTLRGWGTGNAGILDTGGNNTYRRLDISGAPDGMKAGAGVTVEDCYIHDLQASVPDPHHDGIQFSSVTGVKVVHNTILSKDTSAIAMFANDLVGPFDDILIEDNFLSGGGFNLYCPGPGTTNMRVLNNTFTAWGFDFVTGWVAGPGNVWSGNVDADDSPLTP